MFPILRRWNVNTPTNAEGLDFWVFTETIFDNCVPVHTNNETNTANYKKLFTGFHAIYLHFAYHLEAVRSTSWWVFIIDVNNSRLQFIFQTNNFNVNTLAYSHYIGYKCHVLTCRLSVYHSCCRWSSSSHREKKSETKLSYKIY